MVQRRRSSRKGPGPAGSTGRARRTRRRIRDDGEVVVVTQRTGGWFPVLQVERAALPHDGLGHEQPDRPVTAR
jgi:hypothetical protein